jgi:allophanate hydrolase
VFIGEPFLEWARSEADRLDREDMRAYSLHGVPFVVKDNIDVAGVPTTCACPSFAYMPTADALVIARLRAAGAIPVAKTNLDQFATGLVGVRSPHGTPRNPLHPELVPGGSSSGSAVAVARGLVPFSLGTDTAGSGRVPAALCGIVGIKPSVGRLPSLGVVPAVRRIDCVSTFARRVDDARLVADLAAGIDPVDPYTREASESVRAVRRVGIASSRELSAVVEPDALVAYEDAIAHARQLGLDVIEVAIDDFLTTGALLYGGAFVAERTASVGAHITSGALDIDPTVGAIINGGLAKAATEAYETEYRLIELRSRCASMWSTIDALILPTTPGVATRADVAADPVGANARLGTFTTPANLLDLAVVCVPVGARPDGLPAGVQLIGPAWSDDALCDVAASLMGETVDRRAARVNEQTLVVVGAHLSGMALHHQLASRGARLVQTTTTAPSYRLFALAGTVPAKPGLQRVSGDVGAAIVVEVWALAPSRFASFVAEIPPPLGIGKVELADGSWHSGFVCEPIGFIDAIDITSFGGWRAFVASQNAPQNGVGVR